MDEKYWDKIAENYELEIFDTLKNDLTDIIIDHINRFSSRRWVASDFGCGVGKYLPILGERFKTVYAIDLSNKCLELSRESCRRLDNIVYVKGDLADPKLKTVKTNFAISVNMLIMPSGRQRAAILKNISRKVVKGGYFLLIVPSLESALYTQFRLRERILNPKSRHKGRNYWKFSPVGLKDSPVGGLLNWAGVPTKHFLEEELISLLSKLNFKVLSVRKVEYSWNSIYDRFPKSMKQPYPWDWLVVSRKTW